MEPPRRGVEIGVGTSPHPTSPHLGEGNWDDPSPNTPPRHPISPHIDEDALEGLYFGDRRILRCLPYFLRKTRPRGSYDLLEAFSPSLAADRSSVWRAGRPHPPIRHSTRQTPHLNHIDEDALEGLYFAFSLILRCLPYFFRKTRPRASYELLEAFSPSLPAERGATDGRATKSHAHTWEPGILKVGLSITREPRIRIQVGEAQGARFAVPSSEPPAISLSNLHPARPIHIPPPHTRAPTRPPTHAPTPDEKKLKKKT